MQPTQQPGWITYEAGSGLGSFTSPGAAAQALESYKLTKTTTYGDAIKTFPGKGGGVNAVSMAALGLPLFQFTDTIYNLYGQQSDFSMSSIFLDMMKNIKPIAEDNVQQRFSMEWDSLVTCRRVIRGINFDPATGLPSGEGTDGGPWDAVEVEMSGPNGDAGEFYTANGQFTFDALNSFLVYTVGDTLAPSGFQRIVLTPNDGTTPLFIEGTDPNLICSVWSPGAQSAYSGVSSSLNDDGTLIQPLLLTQIGQRDFRLTNINWTFQQNLSDFNRMSDYDVWELPYSPEDTPGGVAEGIVTRNTGAPNIVYAYYSKAYGIAYAKFSSNLNQKLLTTRRNTNQLMPNAMAGDGFLPQLYDTGNVVVEPTLDQLSWQQFITQRAINNPKYGTALEGGNGVKLLSAVCGRLAWNTVQGFLGNTNVIFTPVDFQNIQLTDQAPTSWREAAKNYAAGRRYGEWFYHQGFVVEFTIDPMMERKQVTGQTAVAYGNLAGELAEAIMVLDTGPMQNFDWMSQSWTNQADFKIQPYARAYKDFDGGQDTFMGIVDQHIVGAMDLNGKYFGPTVRLVNFNNTMTRRIFTTMGILNADISVNSMIKLAA